VEGARFGRRHHEGLDMRWAVAPLVLAVTMVAAPHDPARAAPAAGHSDSGQWGVYARAGGRSFDWSSRDLGWTPDSNAAAGDVEAGYGVRRGGFSALLGYEQPDGGSQDTAAPVMDRDFTPRPAIPLSQGGPPGVLGLSLVARLR
jgi:hypothetical protein